MTLTVVSILCETYMLNNIAMPYVKFIQNNHNYYMHVYGQACCSWLLIYRDNKCFLWIIREWRISHLLDNNKFSLPANTHGEADSFSVKFSASMKHNFISRLKCVRIRKTSRRQVVEISHNPSIDKQMLFSPTNIQAPLRFLWVSS